MPPENDANEGINHEPVLVPAKSPTGGRRELEVLVVDDSAVVRQVMASVLSQEPGMHVRVAGDPLIALEKMSRQRPDVILLDLEMPHMDGLTFLRKIMSEDPIPVIICSALAPPGSDNALSALCEGALDVIATPTVGVRNFLFESGILLIDTVRSAAHARVRRRAPPLDVVPRHSADAVLPRRRAPGLQFATDKVVVIGASTGGTEAIRNFLEPMPPDAPAIVIVQHMPEEFTFAFARRLDSLCAIEVKEAESGDHVLQGRALIAPGDKHTLVRRSGGQYVVEVREGPLVSRHRPSVDVLFRSTAQAAGPHAIGVIMTGMGDDGAAGLLEMKKAGAWTVAQDEASCVVFGMPKEALSRGAVHEVCPLSHLGPAVLERVRSARQSYASPVSVAATLANDLEERIQASNVGKPVRNKSS